VSTRLIVSVSGLGSCPLDVPARLAAELDSRGVPLSLVVTPSRLAAAPLTTEWIRKRIAGGDALLLRGFDQLAGHLNPARWPVRTAVLPAHETRLQLIAARTALNQLDLTADGYAPEAGWSHPAPWKSYAATASESARNYAASATYSPASYYPAVYSAPARFPGRANTPNPGGVEPSCWARPEPPASAAWSVSPSQRPAWPARHNNSNPGCGRHRLHHEARPTTYPGLFTSPAVPRPRSATRPARRSVTTRP